EAPARPIELRLVSPTPQLTVACAGDRTLRCDESTRDVRRSHLVVVSALDPDVLEHLAQNRDVVPWLRRRYLARADIASARARAPAARAGRGWATGAPPRPTGPSRSSSGAAIRAPRCPPNRSSSTRVASSPPAGRPPSSTWRSTSSSGSSAATSPAPARRC